jgi:hypothetical protein
VVDPVETQTDEDQQDGSLSSLPQGSITLEPVDYDGVSIPEDLEDLSFDISLLETTPPPGEDYPRTQPAQPADESKMPSTESASEPLLPPEDVQLSNFVTGLQAERHELSANWKRFLGREIVSPQANYEEEIKSAVNHFLLRKTMQMLKENIKELQKADANDEYEVNTLLELHQKLNEMKVKYSKEMGVAVW